MGGPETWGPAGWVAAKVQRAVFGPVPGGGIVVHAAEDAALPQPPVAAGVRTRSPVDVTTAWMFSLLRERLPRAAGSRGAHAALTQPGH